MLVGDVGEGGFLGFDIFLEAEELLAELFLIFGGGFGVDPEEDVGGADLGAAAEVFVGGDVFFELGVRVWQTTACSEAASWVAI